MADWEEWLIFASKLSINMATTFSSYSPIVQNVSSADALWVLIQNQKPDVRRVLTERLCESDVSLAEKIVLKKSIERGWNQVKKMAQSPEGGYTLDDLIHELNS